MARSGKVSVIGAGFYGSTTALRLAEYDIFETVVLTDVVEGKAEGLALDMNQSRWIEGFETKLVGQTTGPNGEGYEAIAGSEIVVITAGLPRKPGMSRMDLIETNAKIMRAVAENIAKHAPDAVIVNVANPLDEMTALAQIVTKFPYNRVIGQAGMLDTARFTHFVAEKLNVPVGSVTTLTLGSHGDTMVPVLEYSTVSGIPVTDLVKMGKSTKERLDEIVARTRSGGGEIVGLLKTGSAYYAPATSAIAMAEAYLGDQKRILPCAVHVDGKYGLDGLYVGVPVVIGANGAEEVIEINLDAEAKQNFQVSVDAVKELLVACKGIDSSLA